MIERDLEGWTLAFDLDGTLVETHEDLVGTLNRMLVLKGLPPAPMEMLSEAATRPKPIRPKMMAMTQKAGWRSW